MPAATRDKIIGYAQMKDGRVRHKFFDSTAAASNWAREKSKEQGVDVTSVETATRVYAMFKDGESRRADYA